MALQSVPLSYIVVHEAEMGETCQCNVLEQFGVLGGGMEGQVAQNELFAFECVRREVAYQVLYDQLERFVEEQAAGELYEAFQPLMDVFVLQYSKCVPVNADSLLIEYKLVGLLQYAVFIG